MAFQKEVISVNMTDTHTSILCFVLGKHAKQSTINGQICPVNKSNLTLHAFRSLKLTNDIRVLLEKTDDHDSLLGTASKTCCLLSLVVLSQHTVIWLLKEKPYIQ